jgi:hypothetical protein
MDNRRRFIFRASAAAFGGHIIRPKDIVLEAPGASALPVTGGRSVANIPATRFDDFFSIESAKTTAEGLFEDHTKFLDFTNHKIEQDALVAVTQATAEVNTMIVGRKPRLTIKHLRGEVRARSPLGSGLPAIRVGELAVDGVDIDGHRLIVELNPLPFQRFDTYAKLLVAADDPAFVKDSGDALYMRTGRKGETAPPAAGRLIVEPCGTIYATVVRSIRWDGPPIDGAEIDRNYVRIPDFGTIFFGELLINQDYRRLTMVRLALGSDSGGSASGADVQDNGGWGWTP